MDKRKEDWIAYFLEDGESSTLEERREKKESYAKALYDIYHQQDKYRINQLNSYTKIEQKYEVNKFGDYEVVLNKKQLERSQSCVVYRDHAFLCGRTNCPNCEYVYQKRNIIKSVKALDFMYSQKCTNGRNASFRIEVIRFYSKKVTGENLGETLMKMSKAFSRLRRDNRFGNQLSSVIRAFKIEVMKDGMYMPYIEAIFYFKAGIVKGNKTGGSTGKNFGIVKEKEWIQLWKKYMGFKNHKSIIRRIFIVKKRGSSQYKVPHMERKNDFIYLEQEELNLYLMSSIHRPLIRWEDMFSVKIVDGIEIYEGNLKVISDVERAIRRIKKISYIGEFRKMRLNIS